MLNHAPSTVIVLREPRWVSAERAANLDCHLLNVGGWLKTTLLQFHGQFSNPQCFAFHQDAFESGGIAKLIERSPWQTASYFRFLVAILAQPLFVDALEFVDMAKSRAIVALNGLKGLIPLRSGAAAQFNIDIHAQQSERVSIGGQPLFSEARINRTVPNFGF
jgi:hypothetical protein